ncbi:hypothetical protein U5U50_03085 [Mycoplasma sp. 888]|uniref:hypothetical protein n=1 Tax=Mycoplasma sp. 888 TaxID=3108483 RepID=UPI002D78D3E3|nr:hypothetical protein [Mycoplasma sp. 888]WRQ25765.1 hypothetical protein U5U50_03085 [Mycoplasma sp. 888]
MKLFNKLIGLGAITITGFSYLVTVSCNEKTTEETYEEKRLQATKQEIQNEQEKIIDEIEEINDLKKVLNETKFTDLSGLNLVQKGNEYLDYWMNHCLEKQKIIDNKKLTVDEKFNLLIDKNIKMKSFRGYKIRFDYYINNKKLLINNIEDEREQGKIAISLMRILV